MCLGFLLLGSLFMTGDTLKYCFRVCVLQPEEDGDIVGAVNAHIREYSSAWPTADVDTASAWASDGSIVAPGVALSIPALLSGGTGAALVLRQAAQSSWEARESRWHSYMLRSGLTYDSYYGNHILNQNGNYLFISGEQAGMCPNRDGFVLKVYERLLSFRYYLQRLETRLHTPWPLVLMDPEQPVSSSRFSTIR